MRSHAVSAEFTPPTPLSHTYSILQNVPDKRTIHYSNRQACRQWPRQARDSFTMLKVRSFARYLYAQNVQPLISPSRRCVGRRRTASRGLKSSWKVCESVGYHHIVDKLIDWRHRVRYVRHYSSVARARMLICTELHLSG